MTYTRLLLAGAFAVACASKSPPPAASSDTVMAATDNPSPSTAPVSTDVMRAAEQDRASEGTTTRRPSPTATGNDLGAPPANTLSATDTRSSPAMSGASASRTPASAPAGSSSSAADSDATQPDNSRVNQRDRSGDALTPVDQGGSESDRNLTQQIRQAVMKDDSLSFTAKNVKIITVNGKVTLRGPVKSAQERAAIETAAKKLAGANQVENLIEVKK